MGISLAGKVAVITGGSSGIGLATAHRFVAEGASVFIAGRRQAELDRAVAAVGGDITAIQADTSKLADLDRLYAAVKERGRLDIVFANAGILEREPMGRITEASVDRMLSINLKGTIFTVQKALPLLADGGSIVVVASGMHLKGFADFGV